MRKYAGGCARAAVRPARYYVLPGDGRSRSPSFRVGYVIRGRDTGAVSHTYAERIAFGGRRRNGHEAAAQTVEGGGNGKRWQSKVPLSAEARCSFLTDQTVQAKLALRGDTKAFEGGTFLGRSVSRSCQ